MTGFVNGIKQKESVKMSKFSVGDTVVPVKPVNRKVWPGWYDSMKEGKKAFAVKSIFPHDADGDTIHGYRLENGYLYREEWLRSADEPTKKTKRGKFETLDMMSNYLRYKIESVCEGIVVELDGYSGVKSKTFKDGDFKRAYKWLLKQAMEDSEEFKDWYEGKDDR